MLPMAMAVDVVIVLDPLKILGQQFAQLGLGPYVELALLALAVGIERRIERPLGRGHFAGNEVQGLLHHLPVEHCAAGLIGLGIERYELGIVVEHLLEMGHLPDVVHRIAGKTTAHLVVDAPVGHFAQREVHMVHQLSVVGQMCLPQQKLVVARHRKLGRTVWAALHVVHVRQPGAHHICDHALAEHGFRLWRGNKVGLLHAVGELGGILQSLLGVGVPQAGHILNYAHPLFLGEIGAAIQRSSIGQGDAVERPTSTAGHQLHGSHVYLVHIGPFFSINFYIDEQAVHHLGHCLVLKALALHDVTPMAGAVADADEQQSVRVAGQLQRLITPRVPLHRVVGMLQQIGTRLVNEVVGVGMRPYGCCHARSLNCAARR
jgi:hypothetical protein